MSKIKNKFLANVPTQTFKGRTTAGTGNVEDLTATQATAILNAFVGDSGSGGTKGLVLAPGAGDAAAGKFLSADGTFKVPGNVTTGDINETSFTAADNQAAPANVTGLAFANGTVRSFRVHLSIVRASTYANYELVGIQRGADWAMDQSYVGDVTGLVFSITTAGQIQYTSTSTGSTALLKFRAQVTTV